MGIFPEKTPLRKYKEAALRYAAVLNDDRRMSNVAGAEPGTVAQILDATMKLQEAVNACKGQTTMLLDSMEGLEEALEKQFKKFLLGVRLKQEADPQGTQADRFVEMELVRTRVDLAIHNITLWLRAAKMYVGMEEYKLREMNAVRKELQAYKEELVDPLTQRKSVAQLHAGFANMKLLLHKPLIALNEANAELEEVKKLLWKHSNAEVYRESVPYIKAAINKAYLLLAADEKLMT